MHEKKFPLNIKCNGKQQYYVMCTPKHNNIWKKLNSRKTRKRLDWWTSLLATNERKVGQIYYLSLTTQERIVPKPHTYKQDMGQQRCNTHTHNESYHVHKYHIIGLSIFLIIVYSTPFG